MELNNWVDEQLTQLGGKIAESGNTIDELSFGKMTFFLSLRRALASDAAPQDVGLLDAVNDTLQQLKLVQPGKTFYSA